MSDLTYDDDTTAELAACTSRMEQMEVLIAALGGGPRTWTCKRATSWVSWAAATTFYEATVTGTMSALVDKLDNFGVVTAIATRLPAALNSGTSFFRITRGSRYVQGSMGLEGSSKDMMIPANLSGDYSMSLNSFKIVANQSLPIAPDRLLYSVSMLNTSGGTQGVDFVSPMFGLPFKQGDIPASTYPQIKTAGGTVCPATLHSITSWPDGSMKFCGAFCRVPASIAGSGTLVLQVHSGAAAPASGARSTSDLTAADIKTELVGSSGLTGTWLASLSDAVANGIISVLANGPAGALYRIWGAVKDGSNNAHGQIVCDHYVMAMTNAAGALLGLRYLGRIMQPFCDADPGGAPAQDREFTATLKRGATTIRALQGYSSSPSVPSSTIRLCHYASIFTCGTDARWDFVQGGGSDSADCTVRVLLDMAYLKATHLIPPWDLDAPTFASTSANYIPMGTGAMNGATGSTGERFDIGIMTEWQVRQIRSQTVVNERVNRVNGLAVGGWRYNMRKRATRKCVPTTDPRSTYAGLGTIETTWRQNHFQSGQVTGFVNPSPNNSPVWIEDGSHRAAATYFPYLATGEPQFADLLAEVAFYNISSVEQGTATIPTNWPQSGGAGSLRNTRIGAGGAVRKGAGLFFNHWGGARTSAWASRDNAYAASILPDVSPDGDESRLYLRDCQEESYLAILEYSQRMDASWAALGIIAREIGSSPWMEDYLRLSLCIQADVLPGATINAVRDWMAQYYTSLYAENPEMGNHLAYRVHWVDGANLTSAPRGRLFLSGFSMSFSAATNRATITGGNYLPTNGDRFSYPGEGSVTKPIPGDPDKKIYYAVNCSGRTFQIANTLGGSPLTIPVDVVCPTYNANVADLGADVFFVNYATYTRCAIAVANYLIIQGVSSMTPVREAFIDISEAVDYDELWQDMERFGILETSRS